MTDRRSRIAALNAVSQTTGRDGGFLGTQRTDRQRPCEKCRPRAYIVAIDVMADYAAEFVYCAPVTFRRMHSRLSLTPYFRAATAAATPDLAIWSAASAEISSAGPSH